MVRSEDQEEELISSVYMGGLPSSGTSRGQKVIVGGASGIIIVGRRALGMTKMSGSVSTATMRAVMPLRLWPSRLTFWARESLSPQV